MKTRSHLSLLGLILLLGGCATPTPTPIAQEGSAPTKLEKISEPIDSQSEKSYQEQLQAFILEVSKSQVIPIESLEPGFRDSKNLSQVKKLVAPPPLTFQKNWQVYRSRFVEPIRIKAGMAFIQQNRLALEAAEQESGVPYQVIAAIIGVETIYGRHMGNFRVKDVLTSLAFDYPEAPNRLARQTLFRDQLKDLVTLCWRTTNRKQEGFNRCLNQSSSYAGAIGLPQFMPGSILQFAKDGDGDGLIDLRKSNRDAIFSVANFLKVHGWQAGMPIYFPTINQEQTLSKIMELADGQPIAKLTVKQLIELGILEPKQGDLFQGGVEADSKALIVDLPSPGKGEVPEIEYVVGLANFLSIVNYNRSYFYAQSVAEFAEALGYSNKSIFPVQEQSTSKPVKEQQKPKKEKKVKKVKKSEKPAD
ncbi:MAG: lytic murein transglycosylase [Burkholderiaceae bacterium]|nr:lytic murein transglycosylase [Burkholderiaceae bacterium]